MTAIDLAYIEVRRFIIGVVFLSFWQLAGCEELPDSKQEYKRPWIRLVE